MTRDIAAQTRKLWLQCFDDTEEFVDMYFEQRYRKENNMFETEQGAVVAALQMIHYPMTLFGGIAGISYVSGACTHPDYRNRGLMSRLLQRTLLRAWHNRAALSALIPAELWLFDYYARMDYAPVYTCRRYTFTLQPATVRQPERVLTNAAEPTLVRHKTFDREAYRYLKSRLLQRPCCVQHTEADFRVILADLEVSHGRLFTLRLPTEQDKHHAPVALAILYPDASSRAWRVDELTADTPAYARRLLSLICGELHVDALSVTLPAEAGEAEEPTGMARIIHLPALLRQYAAYRPEADMHLHVTDPRIPVNSGYYSLRSGQLVHSRQPAAETAYTAVTIGQLTRRLFAGERAYMSLMLN
ncbi:MAG: GNAT family N-acetyltransferase [Prevotellaceae bacterium]|jgi:predicted acetyltransferase|nr:GNAT family N-acetyltransferase [Prevotellaceae bacterium]